MKAPARGPSSFRGRTRPRRARADYRRRPGRVLIGRVLGLVLAAALPAVASTVLTVSTANRTRTKVGQAAATHHGRLRGLEHARAHHRRTGSGRTCRRDRLPGLGAPTGRRAATACSARRASRSHPGAARPARTASSRSGALSFPAMADGLDPRRDRGRPRPGHRHRRTRRRRGGRRPTPSGTRLSTVAWTRTRDGSAWRPPGRRDRRTGTGRGDLRLRLAEPQGDARGPALLRRPRRGRRPRRRQRHPSPARAPAAPSAATSSGRSSPAPAARTAWSGSAAPTIRIGGRGHRATFGGPGEDDIRRAPTARATRAPTSARRRTSSTSTLVDQGLTGGNGLTVLPRGIFPP